MNSEAGAADPRLAQILELIAQLNAGDLEVRGPRLREGERASGRKGETATTTAAGRNSPIPTRSEQSRARSHLLSDHGDGLDKIIIGLNELAVKLSVPHIEQAKTEQRHNEIIESITAFASQDFNVQVPVSDEGDILDAVAIGLNMLGEELQASTISKDYFNNIIQSMQNALMVLEPNRTIQTVNSALCTLLGYQAYELIGQPLSMIWPQAGDFINQEHSMSQLGALSHVEANDTLPSETTYLAKDGREIPVLFSASVIQDDVSHLQGIVCVAQDMTDKKIAEEAIQSAHTQLQASAAELAQANRHLEQLLYSITHDLKEPLRSIQFFSGRVQARYASQLDPKGQDYLERVMRAAERQRQLLKDISLLAQVQQERPMAPYAISATTIVQAALIRLETQINETEAQVDVAPDLPVIQANQKWASQAVYELVRNALKYTADDHPPEVQIAPYDGPKGIGLIIKDRGPSVKPAHAERIWGLFQRAVGRDIEGTGAGLAIVRQIAERHGGHAWLQPRDGGGSEFMITFGSSEKQS